MPHSPHVGCFIAAMLAWLTVLASRPAPVLADRPFVPGTGQQLDTVGDDFEKDDWSFVFNLPKSSENIDKQTRLPDGRSANGRWYEGNLRGCPDIIRRVETPKGGLEGSSGALRLKTKRSGVPGSTSGEMQQDDLIVNVAKRLGHPVPVSWSPSMVVRVYLPPFEEWEKRTGIHFGFRADAEAYVTEQGKGLFSSPKTELKQYWPGIFIHYTSKADSRVKEEFANFLFRAGPQGFDFPSPKSPKITAAGWWTLGISITPDGQVHYYVSQGVDDLTEKDYVASQFPYGYRCDRLNNFFFNVANKDDGRSWSTVWIIDDPRLYVIRDGQASGQKPGRR